MPGGGTALPAPVSTLLCHQEIGNESYKARNSDLCRAPGIKQKPKRPLKKYIFKSKVGTSIFYENTANYF